MDIKSAEDRSRNMAAIRSKDTKPEIFFRKLLFANGFRYRKNVNYVPGHPDLYLAKYHTAIFVHGCFWHRHKGCKYAYMPKSRQEFWNEKFEKNIKRDEDVLRQLADEKVRCLILWECTVRKMIQQKDFESHIIKNVICFLNSSQKYMEI
jgi:DNA mismatch endonuclease (patch repair protein)